MEDDMRRITVTEVDEYTGEKTLVGWFDAEKLECFPEDTTWNGSNHISINTGDQFEHEQLARTAGGRWVMNYWSDWQGGRDVHAFVEDTAARDWLLRNGHDEAAEKYFGEVEEEKGPGRPEVGAATNIRLGDDLTAKVDAVRQDGESRAAAIRRLLATAL